MVRVRPSIRSVQECLAGLAASHDDDSLRELFCHRLGFSPADTADVSEIGLSEAARTIAVTGRGLRVVRLTLDGDAPRFRAEPVSAVLDHHPGTIAAVSDRRHSRLRFAVRSPWGRPWYIDIGPQPAGRVVAQRLTVLAGSGRRPADTLAIVFDPNRVRREFIQAWKDCLERTEGDPALEQGMRGLLERLCGLLFLEAAGRLPAGHTRDLRERSVGNFAIAIARAAARFGLDAPTLPPIPNEALDSAYDVLSDFPLNPQPDPDDCRFAIDPDILALAFEQTVMAQRVGLRRKTGSFYTPRVIARFMCREALSTFLANRAERDGELDALLSCRICDPAVGPGEFALWMVRELSARITGLTVHGDDGPTSQFELKRRLMQDCVRGVDVFWPAVELCRLRLTLELQLSLDSAPSFPPRLPDLTQTIIHGDSLLDHPFPAGDAFDLVIGNPPYVHTKTGSLDPECRRLLRNRYQTATGQFDASSVFIELATGILADRGSVAFIHPIRLLSTQNNEPVRRLIRKRLTVQTIARCGMPFSGAGVEACVLIATRGIHPDPMIRVLELANNSFQPRPALPRALITGLPWGVVPVRASQKELDVAVAMSAFPRKLGGEVTITRGFECGRADSAISGEYSPGACKLVTGEDVQRHRLSWSGLWAAPDWSLTARYKRRELYLTVPKILIRYVSRGPVAAMDEEGMASANVLYHVHSLQRQPDGSHLWFLLAMLNSEPVDMWFRTVFMNDDLLFPHVQRNQLAAIPLPPHCPNRERELGQLARRATGESEDGPVCRMIDDLAWDSYGLRKPSTS